MMVRFVAVIFFIHQAVRHSLYQGEKRDVYTYLTFLFLAISELCLTSNRVLQLCLDANAKLGIGPEISKNSHMCFIVLKAILRPGLGYVFQ